MTTDKPWYLPGETVSGLVAADYFFGKAVGGARVNLTAATFHEKPVVIAELRGQTDAAGKYAFEFADGTHGSTQATILALRALLEASATPPGQEFEFTVTVLLNGEKIETFRIHKDNSDVIKQIDLTRSLRAGTNRIQFRQDPAGELNFQWVSFMRVIRVIRGFHRT